MQSMPYWMRALRDVVAPLILGRPETFRDVVGSEQEQEVYGTAARECGAMWEAMKARPGAAMQHTHIQRPDDDC